MDGGGLILKVSSPTARSWVYRYKVGAKQFWMGLGPYPDVTLAEAREAAQAARKLRRTGTDPLTAKRAAQAAKLVRVHLFRDVTSDCIEAHRAGWRSTKHTAQWAATIEDYAFPVLGDMDVAEIGLQHVLRVLKPIWTAKPETASRVRSRMESVLDFAAVHGWRTGDNPARWRGFLSEVRKRPIEAAGLLFDGVRGG